LAPAASPLPDSVRARLAEVSDFSFSYDGSALLALLRHLKSGTPGPAEVAETTRWSDLLERPADFRGIAVTVTGVAGRQHSWRYRQADRADLGPIHELQLRRDDQPIVCKLVCTQDVSDVPVGAVVTMTGYFLTIQQFHSESNRLHHAAVIVGVGPTQVSTEVRETGSSAPSLPVYGILAAVAIGLLIAWFLMRRTPTRPSTAARALRAEHAAPMSLADDLAAWARDEEPRQK
jgi:hypothetical protein